jgi:hypothetical protein
MAWFGLIPSVGKTLVHQRYCTINSEMWRFKPVRVETAVFNTTVGYTPVRIPHIYMGWAYGRVPRDVTDRKVGCDELHPSNLLSGFLDSCPLRSLAWKFIFKQHGRTMLQIAKKRNLALCLSPMFGGLGFPLPTEVALRKRRAPSIRHRLFASICLDDPSDRRIRRLTNFLIGRDIQNNFASTVNSYLQKRVSEVGGIRRRELVLLGKYTAPQWNMEKDDVLLPPLFYFPWFEPPKENRSNICMSDFIGSYIRKRRPKALSLSQLSRGLVHSNDFFARSDILLNGFESELTLVNPLKGFHTGNIPLIS